MTESDLCFLSATELSSLIANREISPVDIVKAILARIEILNDRVNAYIHVCGKQALAAAEEIEAELRSGNPRSPLQGIPVAYKDIYDVKGLPTTGGSKLLKGYVAETDSAIAANLRQTGAICMGKLNTWEFASGDMEIIGDARNPWNTHMITGGSSSGSGAALAARLVPLATGSDTGGSVRTPAAYCGIVGLKPTSGQLNCSGIIPLSWTLDHPGPMARSVGDAAMLYYGMAGEPMPGTVSEFLHASKDSLKNIRIGLPRTYFFENADSEVVTAVEEAAKRFQNMGAEVVKVDLPHVEYGSAASFTIAYAESLAFHRESFIERSIDYTPGFIGKISSVAFLSAEEHLTAQWLRKLITESFLTTLSRVNIILTPTTSFPAHPVGSHSPQPDMSSLTRPVSLTGLPALSVPCGYTTLGLPVGMQLTGSANREGLLFRVGHAYEASTPWHKRKPPVSPGDMWNPPVPDEPQAAGVDIQWVLDMAKINKLSFVNENIAESIVKHVSPVKAVLAEAREYIKQHVQENPWHPYIP